MKSLVALVLSAASMSALAQVQLPLEAWQLPDADAMVAASNVLCLPQAQNALVAKTMQAQGRKREEVLALLPPAPRALSLRVSSAMRENVEDAFEYPEVSTYTYYSFRSEVCFRETLGAVRMPRFSSMRTRITECQREHGPDKSAVLFKCVQSIVREAVPL
jgi:hypothetical protein